MCRLSGPFPLAGTTESRPTIFWSVFGSIGAKQTNMHILVSEETFDDCMEALEDLKRDKRLCNLKSVVLLFLKTRRKGRRLQPDFAGEG